MLARHHTGNQEWILPPTLVRKLLLEATDEPLKNPSSAAITTIIDQKNALPWGPREILAK
jgi:hypothetical protein